MQWLQRWSYPPPHLSIAISLFPVLTHLFLSIFAFPIVFSLKAEEQPVLSEEIHGPAKEFIEFVVQLIPWRQAGVESGIRGMWRAGGMEGSEEQGWRVNVKGWQLHQGSLIENNTAKSQLERILFKFTSPSPISQCCGVGKVGDCNNRLLCFFFLIYYITHQKLNPPRRLNTQSRNE